MAKELRNPMEESIDETPGKPDPAKNTCRGINRRGFLGSMATLGGAATLGSVARSASGAEFSGYPNSFGALTDLTACVGCRSCEKACNEENKLPSPDKPFDDKSVFDERGRTTEKAYTVVRRFENPKEKDKPVYRKVQCNHCREPACATACPVHAYSKTPEGAVVYNPDLCFGCRYCMTACPFNIPAYDYWSALEPRIHKCTLCYPRISTGKIPACAEACPMGVITFGKRDELIQLARKKMKAAPGKYIDHIYGETEVGGTNWMYISGVPFENLGFPTNLPHRPLVEATEGFLSSVPLVFTIWPALFTMCYMAVRHRESEDKDEKENAEVTK